MNGELMLLTKASNDNRWFQEHLEEIRKSHEKEYVAIEDEKVILSDKNLEKLIEKLKKMEKNPAILLIKYIYEKGAILIF